MPTSLGDLTATIRIDDAALDAALDETKKKLEGARRWAEHLEKQFKAGNIGATELAEGLQQVAAESSKLVSQFRSLETASGRAASGSKMMSMMSIEAGRGFEDLVVTGGNVSSVINNANRMFEMYAMQAGLSAAATGGIGIAITLAGVAINALVNHWGEIMAALRGGDPVLERTKGGFTDLNATIKELNEKKVKLEIDKEQLDSAQEALNQLRKDLDAFNAAQGKQTEGEKKSGKAVGEAMSEPEARAAQSKMAARERDIMTGSDQDLAKNLEDQARVEQARKQRLAEGFKPGSKTIKNVDEELNRLRDVEIKMRKDIQEKAQARVGAIIKTAETGVGPAQDTARRQLAAGMRQAGAGKVATQLEAASPEAIKAYEERNAELERELQEANAEIVTTGKEATRRRKKRNKAQFNYALQQAEDEGLFSNSAAMRQAERKQETDARQLHNNKVNAMAGAYGPRFDKILLAAMGTHRKRGITAGHSDAALESRVISKLREVPGELRGDVAKKLVEKARLQFQAKQARLGIRPVAERRPRQRTKPQHRDVSIPTALPAPNMQVLPSVTIPKLNLGAVGPAANAAPQLGRLVALMEKNNQLTERLLQSNNQLDRAVKRGVPSVAV